ncbi:hypothetical protein MMC12_004873 [Toensbergia leucococca]|nr:hypothetical protein [Toensbergia leucococca]
MVFSTEAVIALIGVLVTLPPALLILTKLYKRKRPDQLDTAGEELLGYDHGHEDPAPDS